MKRVLFNLLFILTLISCKTENKQEGYILKGEAKDIPDKTVIFLNVNTKNIDSTIIENEKFEFVGKAEEPTNAVIIVARYIERQELHKTLEQNLNVIKSVHHNVYN